MEKTQLKRHNLVYLTSEGRQQVLKQLEPHYSGDELTLVTQLFKGSVNIPGIIRRDDTDNTGIALGFVPCASIDGRRLRLGAFTDSAAICRVQTPYEFLTGSIIERTQCMQAAAYVKSLAASFGLLIGALGSAGLEIATGLPYTDDASDLDVLIKPASYDKLHSFYGKAQQELAGINMDFELDLPNGYGVKLAEVFMETQTVLGKSLNDVELLAKADLLKFLK